MVLQRPRYWRVADCTDLIEPFIPHASAEATKDTMAATVNGDAPSSAFISVSQPTSTAAYVSITNRRFHST